MDWQGIPSMWARSYLKKKVWRTLPLYDLEDLMQEAWFAWNRCLRYEVEDRHMMALFKRAVVNMLINICTARSRKPYTKDADGTEILSALCSATGCIDEVEMQMLLDDAPEPVRVVIAEFGRRRHRMRRRGMVRETTNQYLSRLAGLDQDVDMVSMIGNWWTGQTGG